MKKMLKTDQYQFEESCCQAARRSATQDVFTVLYYDRDHLGNIRQVTKDDGTHGGRVVQRMSYYPFGAQFCDGTTDGNYQPRRYGGKELDRMHGLNTYDYGARQYNPVTARWDRVDPLCEKYYSISPYAYCAGNPVMLVDPNGKQFITPIPMLSVTDILTFGRSDVIIADGGKIVEVQGRVASSSKQIHHWIPRQFKNHPTVEKAIKGGYKFEGNENKSPLNTFLRNTGKGQHANHPKYNQQIKNKLDNVDKDLSPKQAARAVRQIKKMPKKQLRVIQIKRLMT